jgi:hypothetical protein
MMVCAHRGTDVKIHTPRSMVSTILYRVFRIWRCRSAGSTWMFIDDTLMSADNTLTVEVSTQMVDSGTLMAGDDTLTIGGGTLRLVATPWWSVVAL